MNYYFFFMLYVLSGILICGALFTWAVLRGQFREQDRARYLPLGGEPPHPKSAATGKWPRSMVVTVILISGGLALQIVTVLIISVAS